MAEDGREAKPREVPYLRASVGDLFRAKALIVCDVCGDELADAEEDDGFAVRGKGMFLSSRGDEVHREDVPLCSSCGSAIGLSALRQWEIEEEEG
jgi:hypothetical protein